MPFRLLLVLVLAALAGPAALGQTATVSGTVRDAETGETLIQATVLAEGTGLGVATNREGFYVLNGVGPGEVTLVVSYVGYQARRETLRLGPGETRRLDLALTPAAVTGGEVVVESEAPIEEEKAVGVQEVPIRLIQQIPSAIENDLFRALQLLPGVKAASDFSSRLYIRGGSPDQTLILLDQTTVYNPSHFFGFFSTFNTDAIKDVRVYKGGYPAEYGGRLGSVIDVSNRDGNRNRLDGKVSVGLLASRVNAEGPLRVPVAGTRGSWFLALRRSTLEPLLAALRDREEFIPDAFYFYDVNAKLNLDLSPNDRFSLAGYSGVDDVDFPFAEDARFNLRYGNRTGSARYTRILSDRVFATLRLTGSRYFSLPVADIAGTEFEQRNTIDDISVKADVEWLASPGFEVKGGAWAGDLTLKLNNFFDGQETLASRIQSRYGSAYAQATLKPGPWIVTGGLRASAFSAGGYLRWEPRLSVERTFGERILAQAAYGRYTQYLALISNEAFSAFDLWVTTDDGVPPAYGDQFVLGLKTRPAKNIGFDAEVYYRTLRDLFEFDPNLPDVAGLDYADIFRFGEGYATGLEVQLERPAGRLNGFVAYTLGLTQRKFVGAGGEPVNADPETGEPQFFSPKYDRRHDLSVVANVELGRGWTFSGTFVYATGQAYTRAVGRYNLDLPIGGLDGDVLGTTGLNRARLPAYHRADLGFTRAGRFFGLGDYELRLQGINVYSRRNVWFFQFDFDDEPVRQEAIRMLPFLPNVSLTVDF